MAELVLVLHKAKFMHQVAFRQSAQAIEVEVPEPGMPSPG
jgi:hypothetical protein